MLWQTRESEVIREKEQLQLQIAEMSILARIKQDEGEAGHEEGKGACVQVQVGRKQAVRTGALSLWMSIFLWVEML